MTDTILDDPHLVPIRGTFNWWLDQDFQFEDDVLGLIKIPKYFITDLGSIPRIFWNIIPPEGPATLGYVVHDGLYGFHKEARGTLPPICSIEYSRLQADQALTRIMKLLGVGWWARETVYTFLRPFGGTAWDNDAKKGPQFYVPSAQQ
jgi:hypothetical protein